MNRAGKEQIFVFGASGHAKVVIDIIEKQGHYEIVFLVDDDLLLKGTDFFGYPVIGDKNDLMAIADTLKCSPKIGQLVKLAKTLKPSSQHEAEAQKIQPRV